MCQPRLLSFLFAGWALLASLPSPAWALETASIWSLTPTTEHACVTQCVYEIYTWSSDIGNALSCGRPYANDCFCATNSASASKASSWMTACGSSRCWAGDYSNDMTAMHSVYASYCMNAGFTQPGATAWYTMDAGVSPTPGQTTSSGPTQTTTQTTVVTQTANSSSAPPGTQATLTQVTVRTTSTLWVNSSGSPIAAPSSDPGTTHLALGLGLGLGLGIPLVLALAGLGVWLCLRRRPQPQQPQMAHATAGAFPPATDGATRPMAVSPIAAVSPITRKAVPVTTTYMPSPIEPHSPSPEPESELTGEGVRRELRGTELHPLRPPADGTVLVAAPGHHEMNAQSRPGELAGSGQTRSPPPAYTQLSGGTGYGEGYQQRGDRWELA